MYLKMLTLAYAFLSNTYFIVASLGQVIL